jgi:alkylation response protein AidB-like acyl-CoA dehydrogenase
LAILTEEQRLLRDSASDWARERSPVSAWRKIERHGAGLGYDPEVFAEMAQMGWAGILVPEVHGGVDFGFLSFGALLEQTGRTLTSSPLVVSSMAAVTGLKVAGSAAQKEKWLPPIARGEAIMTLAVDEGARHDPEHIRMEATKLKGGYRLKGEKRPVLHGMAADAAIIAARTSGMPGDRRGITLFLASTAAAGLTRTELHEVERRGAAIFAFADVDVANAEVLGVVGGGADVLEEMLDGARAGMAAEMLGAAQGAFDATLTHLKTRVQFGRLIGEFQALQHRAASLFGELVLTRSAVEAALSALDENAADRRQLASLAKALAGDTFRRVAGEMIQMHGGIGMTEEHDAGLYLKRARTSDMNFGTAGFHRERYGALTGC